MRLERKSGVALVRVVIDERLPLLCLEVAGEQVADQLFRLGVGCEEDVRPVVEGVAVAEDRTRVATDALCPLVDLPVILAALLERIRGAQAGEPGAQDDVFALSHRRHSPPGEAR
jgi:hypothetical protein